VEIKAGTANYYPGSPAIPSWAITDFNHIVTQVTSGGKPVVKGGKVCALLGKKVNKRTGAEEPGINTWIDVNALAVLGAASRGSGSPPASGGSGATIASGGSGSPPASGGGGSSETYTVKKGDTLWGIAAAKLGNGSRYPEIKSLNGLASDNINVGQVLKIPGGAAPTQDKGSGPPPASGGSGSVETYTVKKGDTLWGIAAAKLGNGSRYPEIKQLNSLSSDNINIGQVLKIPGK